jgi:hypothetical protein
MNVLIVICIRDGNVLIVIGTFAKNGRWGPVAKTFPSLVPMTIRTFPSLIHMTIRTFIRKPIPL